MLAQTLLPVHRPGAELERHPSLDAIRPGRKTKAFPVGPAEMRLAGEAGSDRNLRQPHIGLRDKAARPIETDVAVVKTLGAVLPNGSTELGFCDVPWERRV